MWDVPNEVAVSVNTNVLFIKTLGIGPLFEN